MADERDQIKVPQKDTRKGARVKRALDKTPMDGGWHKLFEMGFSSAEQTARAWNAPHEPWELGYTVGTNASGTLVSYLWARWIGPQS
jgi:hypothetical protein